jgi:hypothetical protein
MARPGAAAIKGRVRPGSHERQQRGMFCTESLRCLIRSCMESRIPRSTVAPSAGGVPDRRGQPWHCGARSLAANSPTLSRRACRGALDSWRLGCSSPSGTARAGGKPCRTAWLRQVVLASRRCPGLMSERQINSGPRRSRRPALHRRTRLHGTRPPRRRTLFQGLTEREEKNSAAIASNQSFSGWTNAFTDPCLCRHHRWQQH